MEAAAANVKVTPPMEINPADRDLTLPQGN
jgi:hypothetical protein